jgi:hypothetical protein
MIKEKHLVPGRVLLQKQLLTRQLPKHPYWKEETVWQPCMVVCCYPDVTRRHARKEAPVNGWEVLVLRWGDVARPVDQVRIVPDTKDWKLAW